MKVLLLQDLKIDGVQKKKGDIVEVENDRGNILIAGNLANNPPKKKIEAEAKEETPEAKGKKDKK